MTTPEQHTPANLTSHTPSRRLTGRTALIGLALFAVSLGTFAPDSSPDAGSATATQIRRYAIENAGTLRLNTLTSLICVGLVVFFVACLAQQVRMVRPGSTAPNVLVGLIALIAAETMYLTAVNSLFAVPSQLADASEGAVVTFYQFAAVAQWLYTLTVAAPCMILVATYSWLALRHRLIARGVAWASLALAATGVATLVSLTLPASEVDLFVILLFGWWLWPLAIGGALGVRWMRTR
jgi:hypothetical protein